MMRRWGVEVQYSPPSHFPANNWVLGHRNSSGWTTEENKLFENALALFDWDTPDRWEQVAAMIPGKSVRDVMAHYRDLEDDVSHIEAGLIPGPRYSSSSFTLDWESDDCFDGAKHPCEASRKRPGARFFDQERKKGVPWTEDEHRLFLMGLKKYGKGDWRNISRNFVTSRTPTQVASHAQKYFIRLNSGGKDKRRSSIHDITTVNLSDNPASSPPHGLMESCSVSDSNDSEKMARAFSPSYVSHLFEQDMDAPLHGSNHSHLFEQDMDAPLHGSNHDLIFGHKYITSDVVCSSSFPW